MSYEWVFGDGSSGSGEFTSRTYTDPGFYTVTLTVTDAAGNTDDQTQTVEVKDPNATGAFLEQNGLLVIEAENYEDNVSRNGQTWTESTAFGGFEGSGAMAALPDNGQIYNVGYGNSSPYMNFLASFTNTGTFYVWTRVRAVPSGNTLHVGLNTSETPSAEGLETSNFSDWTWVRTRKSDGGNAFVTINTPGEQDITVWMREDGIHFDRILLTTDANFIPNGGGPAESPRAGGGPTASFTADPTSGVAPLAVNFDASASSATGNASIVSYSWRFGDGNSGSGVFTSHTYTSEGSYTATLTVEDSNGNVGVATTTIVVDPAVVEDPVASFTANPTSGTAPLDVAFDASASTAPPNATIQTYAWDFGDGNAGAGINANHTYTTDGTFTATLTVTDSNGNSDSASTTITVDPAPSGDPVAAFTATPTSGTVPLAVAFDASASTAPPNATIQTYEWSFGDGNTGSGINANHTYTTDGTFTATLTVTDSNGNSDSASTTITVDPAPSGDPVAAFTATPTTGTVPLNVAFDASTSTAPPNATIQTYAWTFGDGNSGSGINANHTYTTEGTFIATLTVTDSNGNSDSASTTITVDPAPTDGAFIEKDGLLVIEAENYETKIDRNGQSWTESTAFPGFEGAAAMAALPDNGQNYNTGYGASSPLMNFLADFTNTGTYYVWARVRAVSSGNTFHVGLNETETPSAESIESFNFNTWAWVQTKKGGAKATVTIGAAGEERITFWMREDGIQVDRFLLTSDASFTPQGAGPPESDRTTGPPANDPVARFDFTPQTGIVPLEVAFDASASSAPPNATIQTYAWNFGDGTNGSGANATHTYTTDGTFTITLTVTDSNGNSNTATNTITVNPEPVDNPVAAFTATPTSGTVPLDVAFDASASAAPPNATIQTYAWDFGDGNNGSGVNANHTYTTDGTFTATLTVTDSNGNSDTETTTITVSPAPSGDPVAAFTATPTAGTVPLSVAFDASASTAPPNATIQTYVWTFGDGNGGSGVNANHTYTTVGTFTATLTVTDSNGNSDTETRTITVNPVNPVDRLLAYWPLDESSGTVAPDTLGAFDGALVNGPVWRPGEGRIDGALDFDGDNDYVDISGLDISSGSGASFAFWFNADDFGVSDARFISKATGVQEQDHYWMVSTLNSTALRFRLKAGGNTTTLISNRGVVQASQWHHVAATYDGSQMRLFLDGAEIASVAKTGGVDADGTVGAALGNQPGGDGNRSFDGRLDDMRVYNYALTAAVIDSLARGGAPSVVAAPVFSPNGGTFSEPVSVTLSTSTQGAEIRYTTDGATPTESSLRYNTPLNIETTTEIRARAFKSGSTPSAIVSALFTINPASSDDRLLAYWPLDESSGTVAPDTLGAFDGALVNGPVWRPGEGRIDGALDFDGDNDYVDISGLDISSGSGASFAFWFNADDFGVSDARFISKATGVQEQDHYWMVSTLNSTALRFRLKAGGNTTTLISNRGVVQASQWHHVAATYDGSQMRLFLDGAEIASVAKTGGVDADGTVGAALGNQPGGDGNRSFDGRLDDMRVYNYALTATAIDSLASVVPATFSDVSGHAAVSGSLLETETTPAFGDASGNGTVSSQDAALIVQHMADLVHLDEEAIGISEVTGNARVTAWDASYILQYAEGMIDCLPVQEGCGDSVEEVSNASQPVRLSWGQLEKGTEPQALVMPLVVTQGKEEMHAIDMTLRFDPGQVTITGVEFQLSEDWEVAYRIDETTGTLRLSMAGARPAMVDELLAIHLNVRHGFDDAFTAVTSVNDVGVQIDNEIDASVLEDGFVLQANYPNPFYSSTLIGYQLSATSHVRLDVFDVTGRLISTLVNETKDAGEFTVVFDAAQLPSGMYFYRLKADSFVETRSMVLVK